jgi:hypothetical protein
MTEKTNTRPPFRVSGIANIKHLNVRKDGPEDEKILAVDVKLEIKTIIWRLRARDATKQVGNVFFGLGART